MRWKFVHHLPANLPATCYYRPGRSTRYCEIGMKKLNLLITGVGGQGVVLASDIAGETAVAAGYDVKKTDTLGMAQRGGSVVSHVRMAERVLSPLIMEGDAGILLAFEKLEAARWTNCMRPDSIIIVNRYALPPLSVNLQNERYPSDEEIIGLLKQRSGRIYFVNGTERATLLGNVKTLNIFMLGCLSVFLPFRVSMWKEIISQHLKHGILKINIAAFEQGRKEVRNALI
jgi:indolepyruvate ferredoxin oxidoreductase beta subunit